MKTSKRIKTAATYAGKSMTDIARTLNTSVQALTQRINRETVTPEYLETIAQAIGAKLVCYFEFPDGTKI